MFPSSFFQVTTPLKAIYLLFNLPLAGSFGSQQGDPLGGLLFTLVHLCAFHCSTNFFPSCLFPSILDGTHIIMLASFVS